MKVVLCVRLLIALMCMHGSCCVDEAIKVLLHIGHLQLAFSQLAAGSRSCYTCKVVQQLGLHMQVGSSNSNAFST